MPITRTDLKKLTELRLKEAKTLYNAGLYDGCVYLCGYVVETALKARICKHLQMREYIENDRLRNLLQSHSFDHLLLLAGLRNKINLSNKKNLGLFTNWSILTAWKPELRYNPKGTYDKEYAKTMIDALEHPHDGFLVWIKKLW